MACSECLAPLDCQWMCAKCLTFDDDAFHVVGPFRTMCEEWIRMATLHADMQTIHKPFVPETDMAVVADLLPTEPGILTKRK